MKSYLQSIPWHPSPKGVFELLERSRSWKSTHGANPSVQTASRYVLLLIFEPTDCSLCLEELFTLNELQGQVPRQRLQIIGVASHTSTEELRKLADAYGVSFPLLLDESSSARRLLGLAETPWKVLVDREDHRIIFDMGPSLWEVERQFFSLRVMRIVKG
ncbi:MAG TPA: TlpA disulfide reductase family protein [Blastocatellia bacterium]|nr:TlpA disulfide reductase family protein [Blastocatellia bacterium]